MTNKNNKNNKNRQASRKQNANVQGTGSRSKPIVIPKSLPSYSISNEAGNIVGRGVAAMGKYLGFGAYTLNKNTILGAGGSVPSMHSANDSIVVRHREYLGDLLSSTAVFTSNSYALNPGLAKSFPWLSKMSQNYQQYRILGMVVEFVPEISEVASSEASLGFVALAAQYRTDLPAYPSLEMALESEWAVSGKPNCPLSLAIECDPALSAFKSNYIRAQNVPANQDIRVYDFVNLVIMIGGQQTNAVIAGQIWLTYEIELFRPTAYGDPLAVGFYLHLTNSTGVDSVHMAGTSLTAATYISYVNSLGTNQINSNLQVSAAADGFVLADASTGQVSVTLPDGLVGSFLLLATMTGTAIGNSGFGNAASATNCSGTNVFGGPSSFLAMPQSGTAAGSSATQIGMAVVVVITSAQASTGNAVITFGNNTSIALGTSPTFNLLVTQLFATNPAL